MQEGSFFSTPSPAFIVCRLFNNGHSDWCEVMAHCSFDLHFSNNEGRWASFHVLLAICMSSLEKCLLRPFPHFFDWVVCFWKTIERMCQTLYIHHQIDSIVSLYVKLLSHFIGEETGSEGLNDLFKLHRQKESEMEFKPVWLQIPWSSPFLWYCLFPLLS